jgi:hypothetical protein
MLFFYIRKNFYMKQLITFSLFLSAGMIAFAQEEDTLVEATSEMEEVTEIPDDPFVRKTYNATRIINGHSVETLEKGVLEFRIEHRFGDVAGDNGGAQNFFGFDNASDIRFAFEYGITDKLMVGLGRNKGTGDPYRSLLDGFVKYRLLHQKTSGMPVSMTLIGVATGTYMKASDDISQISHFPKWQHRLAYSTQVNIARKFTNWLSLSLMPTFVYRNYVGGDDVNALFALGGSAKVRITPTKAIIVEYYQTFQGADVRKGFKNSLGIAYEWDTFGHNFTINLTNSRGFIETQFIPYTKEDWLKGQFRLGFSITRKFMRG